MTKLEDQVEAKEKRQEVFRAAEDLYLKETDWVTFFREVLGLQGIVRQTYRSTAELADFEQSETFAEILQMLTKLREKGTPNTDEEPTRVITVRLPKSLHETLRIEAHEHHTSMNKLCISKLLQFIDQGLIPEEK